MELIGTIKEILPERVLKNDRGEYLIRPIVLEMTEEGTRLDGTGFSVRHTLAVEIWGEMAKGFNLPAGQRVRVGVKFSARVYEGRAFQSVSTNFISCI